MALLGCKDPGRLLIVLTLVTVYLSGCAQAKRIPRWWLKVAQKQGPNACVVEEIPGTSKEFWTECRFWLNRNICGKKTRIRFECCEGFDQMDGEEGCKLVKPLKNIVETAEELGASKWAQYIRESGRQNDLESAGAYTMFVPTNEAFEQMKPSLKSQMDAYRGNPSNPILLYHLLNSKLKSEDFEGDMDLGTLHQGHNIRINKYSNGMTTINCALLIRKNQEATNGIVHVIDKVLDPSQGLGTNIADMILADGRFQIMAEMLEKSGYINVLRNHQGSISILAPYDEAFQKLPESRREKIINDREARLALIQNHVIPHVICESAITGEHKVKTMGGNKHMFNCDIDGAYVESTKLKGNFNIGKNGILHMIDDVLLPDRAKNLVELAESRQLQTFVDLVKKSGLEETLSHTGDYTFFVPEEAAWLEVPAEIIAKAKRDPEYAGLMLRYHGAYGRYLTSEITDNQAIMSLDEENPVRLQVWRRAMGVEDAKITTSDLEAQNGVIHIVSKVIFPSNKTVQALLESIPGETFDTFLTALGRVTSADPSLLLLGPGTEHFYTFFVPTDAAFAKLDQVELDSILTNLDQLTLLIQKHVAVNMFPETSFEPGLIYSINGMQDNFNIRKTQTGNLQVNQTPIDGSHMSANGVVYVINDVFVPDKNVRTSVRRSSISTVSHHGGSSSSHSYSSSSSTSNRAENKFSKTLSVNGDFETNFDNVLPAHHPQGTVIASSVRRKPAHVPHPAKNTLPKRRAKGCSSCRRTNRKRKRKFRKSRTHNPKTPKHRQHTRVNSIEPVQQATYLELKSNTKESTTQPPTVLEIDDYQSTNQPASHTNISTYYDSSQSVVASNNSVRPSLPPRPTSTSNTYMHKAWDTQYHQPTQINTANYSRQSSHNMTSYTPGSLGQVPQVPQTISKIYTYKYTFDNYPAALPVDPLISRRTSNYTSLSSFKNTNSIGPVPPENTPRFSYVGHAYGNDVAGRDYSKALPFSAPKQEYAASVGAYNTIPHKSADSEPGVSSTLTHRKVGLTQTTYTVPTHLSHNHSSFTFPAARTPIASVDSRGNIGRDLVAAYAFTGGDGEFADGAEFSQASPLPEDVIEAQQARLFRKQWRRKRHHQRRKPKKGGRKNKRRTKRKHKTN